MSDLRRGRVLTVEMSLSENVKLLRDYAERGDEAAFRELVARYVDLVYSTALRQLAGDADLARDVAQIVFADLARKAPSLRHIESLGGWLHRHTGFVAAKAVRAEHRRRARERQAAEMNALQDSPDAQWQQLAPVLDETIELLDEPDRLAIMLRFFERHDFRSIGAALRISDDAAQKRVSRALEKLRAALADRGVGLSATLLASFITGRVISAAPIGLAAGIAGAVLVDAATVAGLAGVVKGWMSSTGFKLAAGIVAVIATVSLVLSIRSNAEDELSRESSQASPPQEIAEEAQSLIVAAESAIGEVNAAGSDGLVLRVVAADTEQPIGQVAIECTVLEGTNFLREEYQTAESGVCVIPVPRATVTRLLLRTRVEGYSDTWLHWWTERGDSIPREYTLRLTHAVGIGGLVVDPQGGPVADANVGFSAPTVAVEDARPEMRAADFETRTDSEGRWTLHRIAPEVWRRLQGVAWHPEFVSSQGVFPGNDAGVEQQLLAGTHLFHLGHAVALTGTVIDPEGNPVPNAILQVSQARPRPGVGERSVRGGVGGIRQLANQIDGSFRVSGCVPGTNNVRIMAEGFVPTNFVVLLDSNWVPAAFTIQRGRRARLRVVNQEGLPVPGAAVQFRLATNTTRPNSGSALADRHSARTDAQGELEWNVAPGSQWTATVRAAGYRSIEDLVLVGDDEPQVVTLLPGLTLFGSVRDAESGGSIQHFRIITGLPEPRTDVTNIQWQTGSSHPWIRSETGAFRQAIAEFASADKGLVFKFEAEGYAPFVTRVVNPDESEVEFNVALQPSPGIVVTVLEPGGQPAIGADVGMAYPGARLRLVPGGLARDLSSGGSNPLATDDRGQFTLPPDDRIQRVIAAGAHGYREVTRDELASNPTIQLQPWGRIEGTFLSGAQPTANRVIQFHYGQSVSGRVTPFSAFTTFTSDYFAYQIETDQDGRFVFPQVPPGRHRLAQFIAGDRPASFGQSGPAGSRAVPLVDVHVRPGETETVTIGLSNYIVTARIRWPSDLVRQPGWQVSAVLQAPLPVPPAEIRNDREAMAAWRAKPEIQKMVDDFRRYQFTENPDNVFTTENVAPGEYTFWVSVLKPSTGTIRTNQAGVRVPVTISAGSDSRQVDLGVFELKQTP